MDDYKASEDQGRLNDFYQEMMLRVVSEEERLIRDSDIIWYDKGPLLKNKHNYNWYITTDFATGTGLKSDYSVILVWAVGNKGDWFLVDGYVKRCKMDENIDQLFKYAQMYDPMDVGIEINGQQKGFVSWIQSEMLKRNIFFHLAGSGNTIGIRRSKDKLTYLKNIQPRFAMHKVWLPDNDRAEFYVRELVEEIRNTTVTDIKSRHDDALDALSMMGEMPIVEPSYGSSPDHEVGGVWTFDDLSERAVSPYIV
jgi:predicted phage terminase large subunit-like protein